MKKTRAKVVIKAFAVFKSISFAKPAEAIISSLPYIEYTKKDATSMSKAIQKQGYSAVVYKCEIII